ERARHPDQVWRLALTGDWRERVDASCAQDREASSVPVYRDQPEDRCQAGGRHRRGDLRDRRPGHSDAAPYYGFAARGGGRPGKPPLPRVRRPPDLRRAIADWYERRFGLTFDPDKEVQPLLGSKEGINNVALCLVDPGDVALLPDPGYPPYTTGTLFAGG